MLQNVSFWEKEDQVYFFYFLIKKKFFSILYIYIFSSSFFGIRLLIFCSCIDLFVSFSYFSYQAFFLLSSSFFTFFLLSCSLELGLQFFICLFVCIFVPFPFFLCWIRLTSTDKTKQTQLKVQGLPTISKEELTLYRMDPQERAAKPEGRGFQHIPETLTFCCCFLFLPFFSRQKCKEEKSPKKNRRQYSQPGT